MSCNCGPSTGRGRLSEGFKNASKASINPVQKPVKPVVKKKKKKAPKEGE